MDFPRIRQTAAALAFVALGTTGAEAYVVNIDSFEVYKNGDPLMIDGFDVAGPLNQAGLFQPSGAQAFYGLLNGGAQSEGVVAGRRTLDTALAPEQPGVVNPGTFIKQTGATLLTNTQPIATSTSGLKSDDLIKVVGVFDLVVPPHNPLGASTYEIRLRDRLGASLGDDELRVRVFRAPSSGAALVQFNHRDPTANVSTTIDTDLLDPAHDQIMLMLQNSLNDLTTFTASYAYIDGGMLGPEILFSGSRTIFNGEEWTQAGFRALETVPEPASLALFGVGLMGLGIASRRRRTA